MLSIGIWTSPHRLLVLMLTYYKREKQFIFEYQMLQKFAHVLRFLFFEAKLHFLSSIKKTISYLIFQQFIPWQLHVPVIPYRRF
jgi:hypothetical protein